MIEYAFEPIRANCVKTCATNDDAAALPNLKVEDFTHDE